MSIQTNLGAFKILKYKIWKDICFHFSYFQRTGISSDYATGSKTCTVFLHCLWCITQNVRIQATIITDKNSKWKNCGITACYHISPISSKRKWRLSTMKCWATSPAGEGILALKSSPVCHMPLTDAVPHPKSNSQHVGNSRPASKCLSSRPP